MRFSSPAPARSIYDRGTGGLVTEKGSEYRRAGKIVVVGSLNIDLVIRMSRPPKLGERLLGGRLARLPGGKGAKQPHARRQTACGRSLAQKCAAGARFAPDCTSRTRRRSRCMIFGDFCTSRVPGQMISGRKGIMRCFAVANPAAGDVIAGLDGRNQQVSSGDRHDQVAGKAAASAGNSPAAWMGQCPVPGAGRPAGRDRYHHRRPLRRRLPDRCYSDGPHG